MAEVVMFVLVGWLLWSGPLRMLRTTLSGCALILVAMLIVILIAIGHGGIEGGMDQTDSLIQFLKKIECDLILDDPAIIKDEWRTDYPHCFGGGQ